MAVCNEFLRAADTASGDRGLGESDAGAPVLSEPPFTLLGVSVLTHRNPCRPMI